MFRIESLFSLKNDPSKYVRFCKFSANSNFTLPLPRKPYVKTNT